jgi:hypothetical protein
MLQPLRIISPPHLPLPKHTEFPPADLSSLIDPSIQRGKGVEKIVLGDKQVEERYTVR